MAKHWTQLAACRDEDPELFFPEAWGGKHNNEYEAQVQRALGVCAGCPVIDQCFAFAMEHRTVGVWGNSTEEERKALRKETAA